MFISFSAEDIDAVNLLRGQATNTKTDLDFDDYSLREPYKSKDEDYIKRQLRLRIERASVTVVYLSESAAGSKWVEWEINESVRQGKGIVGVFQGSAPPASIPKSLRDAGAAIVKWSHSGLAAAIEAAAKGRE